MSCNIYYENKKIDIVWKHHVLKIFDCGAITLILTLQNNLIKRDEINTLTKLCENVIDASYSYPLFYIVDSNGKVFKTNIEQINDNRWDEIILEPKIIQISGNGDGLLMISDRNELYGMGNFENVLCCVEPKKIECFSNIKALQIATGDNFALVLVLSQRPKNNSEHQKNFIETVKHDGRDLLKTQVWSFGSINKGLLGCGDHIKRKDYTVIIKLVDIGVYKIHCGSNHAAALTLDGRLFLWGFNNHQQISIDATVQDISSPMEFKTELNGKTSKNILAVSTSASNTVILLNDLSFRILGKNENTADDSNEEFASDLKYEYDAGNIEDNESIYTVPYITSHNKILVVNQKNISMFLLTFLNEEQKNVRALININQKYLSNIKNMDEETRQLVELYENLLYISITNLRTTIDLLQSDCEQKLEKTIINVHFSQFMREYQRYLKQFCDVISFYSIQHYVDRVDKKIIKIVLEKPFGCLEIYEKLLDLIYDLHLYNNNPNISLHDYEIEELKRQTVERKKIIEDFRKIIVPQKIKEAQETFTFWHTLNDSTIKLELHQKERRFIMDSLVVPLKLHDRSILFGKQRFILFNDYLAYSLARTEFIPIHLIWLQAFSTSSSNKFSFKIITPENVLKVYTLTSQDKTEWQKNIRECIWHSLRKNPSLVNQALPLTRYGSYKFTDRHPKYPNYEVEGKWFEGKFMDLCHIKNPAANRLYKCRIANAGELNGHGIIEDITFKYNGEFEQGRLHKYGTWKSKLKPISYKGFFCLDKFHGYGVLAHEDVTYYGEFAHNIKNGYGIEDDVISGNKYIGMWQDGKKHGAGILITMDGSYFEGIFANNQLSGDGLAIFPNGSYYIGELTMDGPNGVGKYFIPETEIIEEIMELDDGNMKMKGNILKGTLSGTWDRIQISNGSMLMNEIFLRTPNSSNYLKIKPERKWALFFENWSEEVFGGPAEKLVLHDRWYRISSFIARKKSFENDMKTNFMLVTEETNSSEYNEMQYMLCVENDNLSIPSISRSNSEVFLKASSSSDEFETSSLRTFSDYSISSIAAPKKSRTSASDFDFVPTFYNTTLSSTESIEVLKRYLVSSIEDDNHPFHLLVIELRKAFCACYANWRSKPTSILSKIATSDWISIMKQVYSIFRLLFIHLPPLEMSDCDQDYISDTDCKLLAPLNFMHQLLLNDEIYSCFFLLYASKNSRQDELYAQRLMACEKKSNEELRQLLKIEPNLIPLLENEQFYEAIKLFKKISQMYCPSEMLQIIKDTFEIITECASNLTTNGVLLSADNLLSTTIYLIVKASINHLGAELSLLTDLMENDIEKLINMEQYIYTTVKIGYLHTISTKFFHN